MGQHYYGDIESYVGDMDDLLPMEALVWWINRNDGDKMETLKENIKLAKESGDDENVELGEKILAHLEDNEECEIFFPHC